jgi:hypothetical protein
MGQVRTQRLTMKKAAHAAQVTRFEEIPNVGPRTAEDFLRLGISTPKQLRRRDPYALYVELSKLTGALQDPCVIDVFISATRFMQGEPARPWWSYTAERKATVSRQPELLGAIRPRGRQRPSGASGKREF